MRPLIPEPHLADDGTAPRPYRLLSVVRQRIREARFSHRTEKSYVHWIVRFIRFQGRRHPRDMGAAEVRSFLSALTVDQGVSASTQNIALAALTFLYERVLLIPLPRLDGIVPAQRPPRVPVVLSQGEVRAILEHVDGTSKLCVGLMYGGGLRVHECVTLRVKDIDLDRREIVIRGGKGNKDRRTPLAESSVQLLRRHIRDAEARFTNDRRLGVRSTGIDPSLKRKYPGIDLQWRWQYVFGAKRTLVDAEGVRRRHWASPDLMDA
jgi:integrase